MLSFLRPKCTRENPRMTKKRHRSPRQGRTMPPSIDRLALIMRMSVLPENRVDFLADFRVLRDQLANLVHSAFFARMRRRMMRRMRSVMPVIFVAAFGAEAAKAARELHVHRLLDGIVLHAHYALLDIVSHGRSRRGHSLIALNPHGDRRSGQSSHHESPYFHNCHLLIALIVAPCAPDMLIKLRKPLLSKPRACLHTRLSRLWYNRTCLRTTNGGTST